MIKTGSRLQRWLLQDVHMDPVCVGLGQFSRLDSVLILYPGWFVRSTFELQDHKVWLGVFAKAACSSLQQKPPGPSLALYLMTSRCPPSLQQSSSCKFSKLSQKLLCPHKGLEWNKRISSETRHWTDSKRLPPSASVIETVLKYLLLV